MKKQTLDRILELSGQDKVIVENFIDANNAETDADFLRLSIVAELDAVSLYERFARKTNNKKIELMFLSLAKEEEVHVGELKKLLSEIDSDLNDNISDGEDEVEDL